MQEEITWINPLGGLGDTLMLSGVLKLALERDPDCRFQLVRRTKYLPFLAHHPAISFVGSPPRTATLIGTDYWSTERYRQGGRAFQCLAEKFNLPLPVSERLWLPNMEQLSFPWPSFPPLRPRVVFSANTDSPRKKWERREWAALAARFRKEGWSVLQTGRLDEPYIPGALSLLGLTTPLELIALLKECDLLISTDSFAMHAAKLVKKPAIILWGPTLLSVYGYEGHWHISAEKQCTPACIGPTRGGQYGVPCTEVNHCMASITAEDVWKMVNSKDVQ